MSKKESITKGMMLFSVTFVSYVENTGNTEVPVLFTGHLVPHLSKEGPFWKFAPGVGKLKGYAE